ncbi:hypothetical protein Hanom_Chr08g00737361 [Helianthus anomalus]
MMKRDTLQKGFFPPATRFVFHTLLMCVSNKTTSFNEIPLKIQNLGYAILQKENFNYSQVIFNDMVKNVETKSFLLFPRFLSYYFEKKFSKNDLSIINQGDSFQINSLTIETFTRMSTPCKTQAEVPEQILAATLLLRYLLLSPLLKVIKPVSSQKEQVVQKGLPHHDALETLVSIIQSSIPGATPLSPPTLTSPIPPNTKLLLDAIDLNLAQTGPSQSPVHENIPQPQTGLDESIFANPPTQPEEVTPLELQVTLGGNPSEATTTSVEPTGLHLDSGYVNKTSLEAIPSITPLLSTSEFVLTTGSIKRLSSVEGRRPQYQEKGASVVDIGSTLPSSTSDKTTASGKSDDPIKLGDGLKYQELTARVEKLDTSVAKIKDMLQQLLTVQTVQSTVVPSQTTAILNELWNLFQPFLQQQHQLAEQQHEKQVQDLKTSMESRFRDTKDDIKAIKAHLFTTTGTASPTVLLIDELPPDNAKKGEQMKEWTKTGIDNGLYMAQEQGAMLRKIPLPYGSKKVDLTQNALDDGVTSVKRDRAAKDLARWNEEKKDFMELNAQGCSGEKDVQNPVPKRNLTRKVKKLMSTPSSLSKHTPKHLSKSHQHQTSTQTAAETSVVSTSDGTSAVSTTALIPTHTTLTHTTTTALSPSLLKTTLPSSPPAIKQKTTNVTTSAVMTTVVETPVVSTAIGQSQTTASHITTTVPSKTSSDPPSTKRRKVIIPDDDSPSPPPIASKSQALVTIPKPIPLTSAQVQKPLPPAGVTFPLELLAVRE